jgi:hypothetical protein
MLLTRLLLRLKMMHRRFELQRMRPMLRLRLRLMRSAISTARMRLLRLRLTKKLRRIL